MGTPKLRRLARVTCGSTHKRLASSRMLVAKTSTVVVVAVRKSPLSDVRTTKPSPLTDSPHGLQNHRLWTALFVIPSVRP
nr:hypothetical protein Itr_chr15CG11530 [Ipomoea trifida]GMD41945.1 hypothetical protein Iba_chr10bCG4590 [Ipomoea batatas]GMD95072.1 hypothetical protein Iba_chr15aCG8750 [Ipomoea batatas]GMD98136.1 hypothetical protein Iba_chr15cCG9260 [Ipomoea batatas]GMD99027.1 hypothetical protein Iba_chr15dCG8460 [Ipomoea batatas]